MFIERKGSGLSVHSFTNVCKQVSFILDNKAVHPGLTV